MRDRQRCEGRRTSGARGLARALLGFTLALSALGLASTAHAARDDLLLISRAAGALGAEANLFAGSASISADGRRVAFDSNATNLHAADGDANSDVFVRDTGPNSTVLASRAGGAGAKGNGNSGGASLSGNGRFVAFVSSSTNLDPADGDSLNDVYVRDLQTNATVLVSRASGAGGAKGNGASTEPSISADGRYVGFVSSATNLAVDDADAAPDVFVRDLQANTTVLVSRAGGAAGAAGNGSSSSPAVSPEGGAVAFASTATNLHAEDGDSTTDIFVRDLEANTTVLASRAGGVSGPKGDGPSFDPSLSAGGTRVAFRSQATNLHASDGDSLSDVYVRDLQFASTTLASRANGALGAKGNSQSGTPSISADGRYLSFPSGSTNLHPADGDSVNDVYLRDLVDATTTLVSRASGALGMKGNGTSAAPSISSSGRFVAFHSNSTNLHPAAVDANDDVFERDVLGSPVSPPPSSPPPTIRIDEPDEGDRFFSGDVTVSGLVTAPAGIAAFCAAVDADAIPARCDQAGLVLADGRFQHVPIAGVHDGRNRVTVWVRDRLGRLASDSVNVEVELEGADLIARSLDVTQGVQEYSADERSDRGDAAPGVPNLRAWRDYRGVGLAAYKKTVVRLHSFADDRSCVRDVRTILHGYIVRSDGSLRRLGSIMPLEGARSVCRVRQEKQRAAPGRAGTFSFVLPFHWTGAGSEFVYVAELNPASITPRIGERVEGNNALALRNVRYRRTPEARINPVRLAYTNARPPGGSSAISGSPPSDPASAFEEFVKISPRPISVLPFYRGQIDITGLVSRFQGSRLCGELADALEDWEDDNEIVVPGRNLVIGLYDSDAKVCAGLSRSDETFIFDIREAVAVVAANRPLTSVGHETGHQLGLPHAGRDPTCYPRSRDRGVSWPPDDMGAIQGWGLDLDETSGADASDPGEDGPFFALGAPDANFEDPASPQPSQFFDLMSYCANIGADRTGARGSDDAWISVRNWNQLAGGAASAARRGAGAPAVAGGAARGRTLRVAALVDPSGAVRGLRINPGAGGVNRPQPGSPYRIVVRDALGRVVSDTAVAPTLLHVDGAEDPPDRYLSAEVPAAGAATVQIVRGSTVIAQRRRSANPARVRVLRPQRRQRVGSRGRFRVRWRASDRDGDRLRASVDYSADGGRSWGGLTAGVEGHSVRLPAYLLSRSRRAMVRVRVSDGFNESVARSTRFRAAGRRPAVRILDPAPRTRIASDAVLQLSGEAFDDRARKLRGRRLVWKTRGRVVGRGERASVLASRVGRRITLVARDRYGRRSRKTIRVRVRRVAPVFLKLRAPELLGRRSRKLRLRVAASLPARLTVRGRGVRGRRSFKVGPRQRRVTSQVVRNRTLRLVLALRSGDRTTKVRLSVPRR